MVMVFGKGFMVIVILESGRILKLMAMECILGVMEIGMKVNGKDV